MKTDAHLPPADRRFRRRVLITMGDDGLEELDEYAGRRERSGVGAGLLIAGLLAAIVAAAWPLVVDLWRTVAMAVVP